MNLSNEDRTLLTIALAKNLLWLHNEKAAVERILEADDGLTPHRSNRDNEKAAIERILEGQEPQGAVNEANICDYLRSLQLNAQAQAEISSTDRDILVAYLRDLMQHCAKLPLEVLDYVDEHEKITLERVYIELEASDARSDDKTIASAIGRNKRIVVLGETGSGKSTLMRHVALQLTWVLLGKASERPRNLQQCGWPYARPHLPIRIDLRFFSQWLQQQESVSDIEALWCFIEYQCQDKGLQKPERIRELLKRWYYQYGALLLLDGLDEVASGPALERVRSIIQTLPNGLPEHVRSHLVVTCRVRDYQDYPERQLRAWPTTTIRPLSSELQARFIQQWYRTMEAEGYPARTAFNVLERELMHQLRERSDLRSFARSPLLLTMMTQIHSTKGLPDSRVKLYADCVDKLLNTWRDYGDAQESLRGVLQLPEWNASADLLNYLGYCAQKVGTARDQESAADLPKALLKSEAERYFRRFSDMPLIGAEERAGSFLRFISHHSNGILQQVAPDTFAFPHRTFQEYFAAQRLISEEYWDETGESEDLLERVKAVIDDSQWLEVLKLAVSSLNQHNKLREAAGLLEDLLEAYPPLTAEGTRHASIVGILLQELDLNKLAGISHYKKLPSKLIDTYLLPLFSEQAAEIPIELRLEGTLVLGHLGDPRPGVATLEPAWVTVPAGPFLFGSSDDDQAYDREKPQRTLNLPAYHIARYPVTNAQFRMFVEDDGYTTDEWWTPAGLQERNENQWIEPHWFDAPHFNAPNQPVVAVSWYEAVAYCRWLSAQLGYEIRLPTEAEWEKAARGVDGWIYSWGNEWHEKYTNTDALGLGRTSPVGLFPQGVSPYGVLDMCGNVWDWTMIMWGGDNPMTPIDLLDIDNKTGVLVRGGAWNLNPLYARSSYRGGRLPYGRNYYQGFRLLTSIMSI